MAQKTSIAWTDVSWNPTHGCSKVSTGCRLCYAETLSLRYGQTTAPWTQRNAAQNVMLKPHKLREPLSKAGPWKNPCRVFVNSMSDLFHEQIPDEYILAVWAVMEAAPQHTFQILTKRPERMRDLLGAGVAPVPPRQPQPPYERREVYGQPGYEVDTEGVVWTKKGGHAEPLATEAGDQGHLRVRLYTDGCWYRWLVSRIVLTAFDRQPEANEQACHWDGDPGNNAISNLRWGTQVDNWADRKRHGNGRSHSKLTARQVAELRIAAIGGENAAALGRRFGISDTQARNIITGRQWGFTTLPGVWLGVSIENRKWVGRADVLRETPAAVRFISAEPLLGPLLPDGDTCIDSEHVEYPRWDAPWHAWPTWADGYDGPGLNLEGIDWLIIGGESGPGHRPFDPDWARALVRYCADECWQEADGSTAAFVKQLGGARPGTALENLPADLRIRDFPEARP